MRQIFAIFLRLNLPLVESFARHYPKERAFLGVALALQQDDARAAKAEIAALQRAIYLAGGAVPQGSRLLDTAYPPLDDPALSEPSRDAIRALWAGGDRIFTLQRRLWLALDTLREGFAVFDSDLKFVIGNRVFKSFFTDHLICEVGVPFERFVMIAVSRGLASTEGQDPSQWRERILASDGRPITMRLRNGHVVRWFVKYGPSGDLVCLAHDVTQDVTREAELERARREAETASHARSRFLANMGHELRTPLNGIAGMAELLCESGIEGENRQYAETIRSSTEALVKIIGDVLDYARGDAQDIQLTLQNFDLNALISDIMTLLSRDAHEKGLFLKLDYDPLIAKLVEGDAGRLRQVVLNLVGNALKFTEAGGVRVSVTREARSGDIVILVADDGPGIQPDEVDQIFDEFTQLEGNRVGLGGTGLGLAISQQIMAAMGGSIWVDSMPGSGCCFGVRAPLPARSQPILPISGRFSQPSVAIDISDPALSARTIRLVTLHGLNLINLRCNCGAGPMAHDAEQAQLLLRHHADQADENAMTSQVQSDLSVKTLWIDDDFATSPPSMMQRVLLGQGPGGLAENLINLCEASFQRPNLDPAQRPMRVLAADDNATNRLVISKFLKNSGFDLRLVSDGAEACEEWRKWHPDVILMDIRMPVLDGREATRQIRAREISIARPPVPIIALTANTDQADIAEFAAIGMDGFLGKPFRKRDLIQVLMKRAPSGIGASSSCLRNRG